MLIFWDRDHPGALVDPTLGYNPVLAGFSRTPLASNF